MGDPFGVFSTKSKTDLPAVNLAIVGAEGVGKSTFIQCALDLKRPPISQSSAKKMSLEGLVYIVSLWEVSVTEITVDKGRGIIWPQCKADQTLPPLVDGVLVIFDATSPESLVETSDMLSMSFSHPSVWILGLNIFMILFLRMDLSDFKYEFP